MKLSKITLGTAQLGLNYGISNISGKPNLKKSLKILKYSYENGITSFDTAPVYGKSEKIIGKFIISEIKFDKQLHPIIISKLPAINLKENLTFDVVYNYIKNQIKNSLKHLKLESIPFYLLHHAPDIYLKDGLIIECLNQLKIEGFINHIGISAYYPHEVEESLKYKEINAIQIPVNLFDHRLIKTSLLKKLYKNKYIIFARSIYLQGLFFLSPTKIPPYLAQVKKSLIKLKEISDKSKISIAKLAFTFVRDMVEITSLVIGVEILEQLAENFRFLKAEPLSNEISNRIKNEFSNIPEYVINPTLWEK